MSAYYHKRQQSSLASAASFSNAIDVRGAQKVVIELPELDTQMGANQCGVEVYGCLTSGGTFMAIGVDCVTSAASGIQTWQTLDTSGPAMFVTPANGFHHIKVHATTAATDGLSACYVHTMRYE